MVLLAAEFMKEAKPYIEDGVHPHSLIRSYRTAGHLVSIVCLLYFSNSCAFGTFSVVNFNFLIHMRFPPGN